ncbi:MAG: hypothetical protein Q9210_001586 [Variospora velana]
MSDRKNKVNDAAPPGFDNTSSVTPENRVGDVRTRMQAIRVNEFHHFFWLAAAPTVPINKNCSPAAGRREREGKEGISFTLDKRHMDQSLAQIQTYLEKRNKISKQAYAQCPSHSLNEVETWAARASLVINEDDGMNKQKKGDWFRILAQTEKERKVMESTQPENERLAQRVKVLKKEEEYRLAKEKFGHLVTKQLAKKESTDPINETKLPGIETAGILKLSK